MPHVRQAYSGLSGVPVRFVSVQMSGPLQFAAMEARATIVADALMDTCKSLSDVASDDEVNDRNFCSALDDIVMCCDQCSWWVDANEVNDDQICKECSDG